MAEIRAITPESFAEDYAAKERDDDPDVSFYIDQIRYGAGYSYHNDPWGRIESRQIALEFVKARGDKLNPAVKA